MLTCYVLALRRRRFGVVFCSPLLLSAVALQFVVPNATRRSAALGNLDDAPVAQRRAFDPRGFLPVKEPGGQDWLANHQEPGQRLDEFISSRPNVPDNRRKKIYLTTVGYPDRHGGPTIAKLQEFSRAFFGLETAVLPGIDLHKSRVTKRHRPPPNSEQILTADVLALLKERLPGDAFALLGVTMEDIYPGEDWNYVFGQATLRDRVGIYSFARYKPAQNSEKSMDLDPDRLLLRRSCHILAHEAGHMFGIAHCVWYQCVMNGSNNLREFDNEPLHLCPVDLRKLQRSVRFDAVDRYKRLLAFYERERFGDEAEWVRSRLKVIEGR